MNEELRQSPELDQALMWLDYGTRSLKRAIIAKRMLEDLHELELAGAFRSMGSQETMKNLRAQVAPFWHARAGGEHKLNIGRTQIESYINQRQSLSPELD